MRIVVAALAAVTLLAAPAIATPQSEPSPDTTEAAPELPTPEAKEDKVCRQIAQTGSRKKERVCKTRKEWVRFNRGE